MRGTNKREVAQLDVVREIGKRMGRAIAVQVLGGGQELAETPWPGLYPLDPDLYDELTEVGIRSGTEEFRQAEAAAKAEYERTMTTRVTED